MTTQPLIDSNHLENVFKACLFQKEEVANGTPVDAVVVEGITATFGFHPQRLQFYRPMVKLWLAHLPEKFQKSKGGGWSFLGACIDANNNQWTGMHCCVEYLFCLGLGLGLVERPIPKNAWDLLPGDLPYYVVIDDADVQ